MSKLRALFYSFIIVLACSSGAFAGETAWVKTDHARMRLLTGVNNIGEHNNFDAALHMNMGKGWHSYWRVPGDAGAPPRFDWSASENIERVDVVWQAPQRFDEFGFQTFGYNGDVYFPLNVIVKQPGKPATLSSTIQTMVCKDICIPQFFELSINLPAGDGSVSKQQKIIDFEKRRVPVNKNMPGLKIDTVVAGPDALVINAYSKNGFKKADVFTYGPDFALTEIPEITPDKKDPRYAMIRIAKPIDIENLAAVMSGSEITITLVNGRSAIEHRFMP